jgi:hypothetical protein
VRSRIVTAVTIRDDDGLDRPGADLVAFSRFKHGAVAPAWRFAEQILDRLDKLTPETVVAERLVVTASCYKYLPLASVTLARALAHLLNRRRAAAAIAPVTQTQLYRDRLIEGDYSTMTLDQRQRFIAQDVIRVDAEVLTDAAVLVIDDLRVTGFHEGRIATLLDGLGVPEVTFAYWATVDGLRDPTLEKRLNTVAVADLPSLRRLIGDGDFVLNSRVCKLILSVPPAELADVLPRLPSAVLTELVAGMECNGYAAMPTYRPAYELMVSLAGAGTPDGVR